MIRIVYVAFLCVLPIFNAKAEQITKPFDELDKAGIGIGYAPPPSPIPEKDSYKSRSDLGAIARWRYDRCMDDATSKPTQDGMRSASIQCREQFITK